MLVMTWTHETPCPLCETPVVWTMTDREYRELRADLVGDPEKAGRLDTVSLETTVNLDELAEVNTDD